MNKTQAEILAEQIVDAVFSQLDRNCDWIVGHEHVVRLVQLLLLEPKGKLKR